MASQTPKDTLPIAAVFTRLFRNLPRLMLTSFLFAVPAAAFFAMFWFISTLLPLSQSGLFVMLAVIPSFPFFAGVVKVTAKMAAGEEKTPVYGTFFPALRENFLRFLFHGVVFYIVAVFSFVSFNIYLKLIPSNAVFIGPFIITILIIIYLCFMFFYIPVMTVTFDIPMRYIYKNSFLMAYGELKKNFIGLLGLMLLFIITTTFLIACYGSPVAVVIVSIILGAFFVPAIASFIVNSAVYQRMYEMITEVSDQAQELKAKETDARKQGKDPAQSQKEFMESVRSFELDESLPDDEYVYFNGRMVKKSVIKKLKEEANESSGE